MAQPRVLVTRSPRQASALADALRAHGLDPVLVPTIELAPPSTFAPLDAAIDALMQQGTEPAFHWLIFTSANAVEAFAHRHQALSLLPPLSSTPCRIAAIGPATARALEPLGIKPALIPPQAIAESLATALLPNALQLDGTPTRFLLIRAESARDHLPTTLTAAGAHVTIVPAYRNVIPTDSIPAIRSLFSTAENYPAAITFTSSSTATNLLALLEAADIALPPDILRISIGPITSQTLRDLGLPPHAEAAEPTIASLIASITQTLISDS